MNNTDTQMLPGNTRAGNFTTMNNGLPIVYNRASKNNDRARGWSITINNFSPEDVEKLRADSFSHLLYSIEKGESGTPHIQGAIYFNNPVAFSRMKKKYPTAHIERAKNYVELCKYCSKLDATHVSGPFELGEMPSQGKRTDLDTMASDFLSHTLPDFCALYPGGYVRYHKGFNALLGSIIPPRDRKVPPTVAWHYGVAGTGKTRTVWDNHEYFQVYLKGNNKWWDGYRGQPVILIDDFNLRFWDVKEFLKAIDRYPYVGEIKGGVTQVNSPNIYITCDKSPEEVFESSIDLNETDSENYLAQVLRRLTIIRRFPIIGPLLPECV